MSFFVCLFVFPKSKINNKSVREQRSPDSKSEHYSLHKCTQHAYYKELYVHWLLDLLQLDSKFT